MPTAVRFTLRFTTRQRHFPKLISKVALTARQESQRSKPHLSLPQKTQLYLACWEISIFLMIFLREEP